MKTKVDYTTSCNCPGKKRPQCTARIPMAASGPRGTLGSFQLTIFHCSKRKQCPPLSQWGRTGLPNTPRSRYKERRVPRKLQLHFDAFLLAELWQCFFNSQSCQSSCSIGIPAFSHNFSHHSQGLQENMRKIINAYIPLAINLRRPFIGDF